MNIFPSNLYPSIDRRMLVVKSYESDTQKRAKKANLDYGDSLSQQLPKFHALMSDGRKDLKFNEIIPRSSVGF